MNTHHIAYFYIGYLVISVLGLWGIVTNGFNFTKSLFFGKISLSYLSILIKGTLPFASDGRSNHFDIRRSGFRSKPYGWQSFIKVQPVLIRKGSYQ